MDQSHWKEQLNKYRMRSLTSAEEELLWDALAETANAEGWKQIMAELFREQVPAIEYRTADWEPLLQAVFNSDRTVQPAVVHRMPMVRRLTIAAAIACGLMVGCYWLVTKYTKNERPTIAQATRPTDIPAPATNRAMITLGNGQRVYLDSAGNGALAQEGNTQVLKLDSGEIAYQNSGAASKEVLYNSISTPKGGQYKLILPDGSRVWLNAATTLRFPIAFTGRVRSVELVSGEAYFEITHNSVHPFTVRVPAPRPGDKDLAVQVLGTSFDINAYPDEPEANATLLTGSVKVSKGNQTVLLHPGQQAQTQTSSEAIVVNSQIDVAGVTAWKDGLFSFDRAGTEAVMRQLARWYDVEVSYEGTIPARQFVGTIPRNVPASDVLKALELNNVHFRIEGKKIIVTQ